MVKYSVKYSLFPEWGTVEEGFLGSVTPVFIVLMKLLPFNRFAEELTDLITLENIIIQ